MGGTASRLAASPAAAFAPPPARPSAAAASLPLAFRRRSAAPNNPRLATKRGFQSQPRLSPAHADEPLRRRERRSRWQFVA
jgi:hypothetical protein